MRSLSKLGLALAFGGFLALVGVQVVWPFIPTGGKLKGAVEPAPAPVWGWASVRTGATFRAFETWYDERAGLRNFWVRLDNEVTYLCFDEATPHKTGTQVVIGEHDWLFERQYVDHAVSPGQNRTAQVEQAVRHMRSVQDKLARRGIPFLLIIAPSKVEVYPEHVPPAYFGGRRPEEIFTNYERYKSALVAAGVNLYDGPQVFQEWKKAGQRGLFSRAGTHWSYAAALQVLQEVRARLNPLMRHPLPPFVVQKQLKEPAQLTDADLISLLNLLDDFPFNHDQPYPVLAPQQSVPVDQLPDILWVHDSFGWPLIELVYNANAARPTESLYYFEGLYRIPGGIRSDTDLRTLDWEKFMAKHDAVVMVWTEIAFEYLGWGFFETVDEHLK